MAIVFKLQLGSILKLVREPALVGANIPQTGYILYGHREASYVGLELWFAGAGPFGEDEVIFELEAQNSTPELLTYSFLKYALGKNLEKVEQKIQINLIPNLRRHSILKWPLTTDKICYFIPEVGKVDYAIEDPESSSYLTASKSYNKKPSIPPAVVDEDALEEFNELLDKILGFTIKKSSALSFAQAFNTGLFKSYDTALEKILNEVKRNREEIYNVLSAKGR